MKIRDCRTSKTTGPIFFFPNLNALTIDCTRIHRVALIGWQSPPNTLTIKVGHHRGLCPYVFCYFSYIKVLQRSQSENLVLVSGVNSLTPLNRALVTVKAIVTRQILFDCYLICITFWALRDNSREFRALPPLRYRTKANLGYNKENKSLGHHATRLQCRAAFTNDTLEETAAFTIFYHTYPTHPLSHLRWSIVPKFIAPHIST